MKGHSIRGRLILTFTISMLGLMLLLFSILIPERIRHDKAARIDRISMLSCLLATNDDVRTAVKNGKADDELIAQMDDFLERYHVDFIVLAQLDGRRVYHPNHALIGKHFVGNDEKGIQNGEESYISVARGTANLQQRAFYRVQADGKTIGFVMVSIAMNAIRKEEVRLISQLLLVFLLILCIGFIAFEYISNGLQKTLLGYEPEEFANIYHQGEETLRANTHEFLNKMHVISGLLQIGQTEDALQYIGVITNDLEVNQGTIVHQIANPTISALLLGKISRARELDIQFQVRKDSQLRKHSPYLSTHDIVTILGNLVENAFDAVKSKDSTRMVEVFISDSKNGLTITVDDSGQGMSEEQIELVKHQPFTTKGKGHGTGLRLIRSIVERRNGYFEIESEVGEGSSFTVSFDKIRRDYHAENRNC